MMSVCPSKHSPRKGIFLCLKIVRKEKSTMIKIAHIEDVKRLQHLPKEVAIVIEEIAGILDGEYGED
jgi:hypothetical protein